MQKLKDVIVKIVKESDGLKLTGLAGMLFAQRAYDDMLRFEIADVLAALDQLEAEGKVRRIRYTLTQRNSYNDKEFIVPGDTTIIVHPAKGLLSMMEAD